MQNQIESQGSQTAKFAHLSNNLNETMMCCYPNLIRRVNTKKKNWKDINDSEQNGWRNKEKMEGPIIEGKQERFFTDDHCYIVPRPYF